LIADHSKPRPLLCWKESRQLNYPKDLKARAQQGIEEENRQNCVNLE
jgi:hypothetical protein